MSDKVEDLDVELIESDRAVFDVMGHFTEQVFGLINDCDQAENLSDDQKKQIAARIPEILAYKNKHQLDAINATINIEALKKSCLKLIASVPDDNKVEALEFCKEIFDYDPLEDKLRLWL
ncbi:hypothetical protein GW933_01455 [Candidatus Falkowbacteria bacterium]|uniref:Uncharacterized protein n=1 Tax=Candidatus Buchananbacteria bacterium CG10_big_fil_rev_8_21_14_0_10_33_19 TaxID=1974525 RepID=A0A2H0W3R3_9BACT|nr:hypothetical protein [Candidatus Falkowbacteria bacterium]PIS05917.1 MAG: hypothetical protein COT80_04075 [Candidatus Buchananbacteria bacterium CG10_big_fil_rev_8_21_14_0_10_33_19]